MSVYLGSLYLRLVCPFFETPFPNIEKQKVERTQNKLDEFLKSLLYLQYGKFWLLCQM